MKKYGYSILILLMLGVAIITHWHVFHHPDSYRIADFKFLRQPDEITCGPTSATMLLNYYNISATIEEVQKKTKTHWLTYHDKSIGMTAPDYIPKALDEFGLHARLKEGTLDQVKQYVSQNRPVIVLVRSGLKMWHYVVVIGYNNETIYIADPGSGQEEEMPVANFIGSWSFATDMTGEKFGTDLYKLMIRGVDITGNLLVVNDR
jgi:ABC-type bacteriocin/lantibiotic exporter with double-glycine peptidase domain